MGDLNHNGTRNVADFTLFASAFGTSEGQPGYNAEADLNGDTRVNVTDFTLFASVYGTDCP
jgi:hypothetical protein